VSRAEGPADVLDADGFVFATPDVAVELDAA
jgi:hypothetical protein